MDEPEATTDASPYPGFQAPERHVLPSGAVFLLRKPQVMKMFRKGQIPNPLMEIVAKVFADRDQVELEAEAEAKGITTEELLEQRAAEEEAKKDEPGYAPPIPQVEDEITVETAFSFMDVIVWAAIVRQIEPVELEVDLEPPANPETPLTADGKLSYDILADADVQYILAWANEEVAPAERFPAGMGREGAGGAGGTVRDTAEPLVAASA